MGIGEQGRIYAEPTTWTGSIGVIIPRYNASELVQKIGLKAEPLMTGEFKDTMSPFRDLSDAEKTLWAAIMKDSFDRFISVIDDNRAHLDDAAVRALATGQVYTANQALDNHLVDEIGYVDDAVTALAVQLQLSSHEAFEYRSTPGLVDMILGSNSNDNSVLSEAVQQISVPRAMYYASWNPWVPEM
jgi:protease-4